MFLHVKRLPFRAKPERGDTALAARFQELLGGSRGVMTGAMQTLFQAWNCRGPVKYRHMLLDIGTEKMGHVEMLACMIGQLLDGAAPDPVAPWRARSGNGGPQAGQCVAGPHHLLQSGLGAMLADGAGAAWTGAGLVASGNLMVDFRAGLALDSHGRLQAARLFNLTADRGARELLGFLIARQGAHQNQWLAAIEELRADGLEDVTVPDAFPGEHTHRGSCSQFWNLSAEGHSRAGRWARGPSPDGKGTIEFISNPGRCEAEAEPPAPDPRLFLTDPRQHPLPPAGVRQGDRRRLPIGAVMRGELSEPPPGPAHCAAP